MISCVSGSYHTKKDSYRLIKTGGPFLVWNIALFRQGFTAEIDAHLEVAPLALYSTRLQHKHKPIDRNVESPEPKNSKKPVWHRRAFLPSNAKSRIYF
jgi:hypothetical protein